MSIHPLYVAALISIVSCSTQSEAKGDNAGLSVLTDAKIVTMDSTRPVAQAMAWDSSGVIVAIGTASDVLSAIGDDYKSVDSQQTGSAGGVQKLSASMPADTIKSGLYGYFYLVKKIFK